jgi:four helix bundle protein
MFATYENSLELIRNLRGVVPEIKKFDVDLADQLRRAASSISLNVAEGSKRTAGNQRLHYEIAHGSANEVKACLDVAEAWGWFEAAPELRRVLDRQLRLLWGLTEGRLVKTYRGEPVRESAPSRGRASGRASA